MNRPKAAGDRNDTTRPVVAYRPKISPLLPSGISRARKLREAAWAGPTNTVISSPSTQNVAAPPSCRMKIRMPSVTSAPSEIRMTRLGPIRSSSMPKPIVANPATMFAAAPKTMTSPADSPNVPAASTAPNANTPASPSRKSAEASRKYTVSREVTHNAPHGPPHQPVRLGDADPRGALVAGGP